MDYELSERDKYMCEEIKKIKKNNPKIIIVITGYAHLTRPSQTEKDKNLYDLLVESKEFYRIIPIIPFRFKDELDKENDYNYDFTPAMLYKPKGDCFADSDKIEEMGFRVGGTKETLKEAVEKLLFCNGLDEKLYSEYHETFKENENDKPLSCLNPTTKEQENHP